MVAAVVAVGGLGGAAAGFDAVVVVKIVARRSLVRMGRHPLTVVPSMD